MPQISPTTAQEVQQLRSFKNPWQLLKKALSSVLILLMIASGFLINWVLAVVYAIGHFSGTGWGWYLLSLVAMLTIFPAGYLLAAYWYGQGLLFWEAYREVIRPTAAKIFAGTLDKMLVQAELEGEEATESEIVAELENRSKHFVEKLPDFIRAYFQVFITGKDVVQLIKKQRAAGADKEAVKNKAMLSMFEALDLQIAEIIEPSFVPFGIVAGTNLLTLYFIF